MFLFPFTFLTTLILGGDATVWICRHLWGPVLLWAGGARLVVHGQENVDPKRPMVYRMELPFQQPRKQPQKPKAAMAGPITKL